MDCARETGMAWLFPEVGRDPSRAAIDAEGRPPVELEAPHLVVLASSSSGNCSVIIHGAGRMRRAALIDCGLSPLRTRRLLADLGLDFSCIDDVLVTHLDGDHFHPGWADRLPPHAHLHIHARHVARAVRQGWRSDRLRIFDAPFELRCGLRASPVLLAHDEWGVVAFRIEGGGVSLGYATDLGRVSPVLIRAMEGVDVMAIESNYCPALQASSDRPAFLKNRIMGGRGHLSNAECRSAVAAISPRRHVVLLHLSRQCNTPELAAGPHAEALYRITVARDDAPTPPIELSPRGHP